MKLTKILAAMSAAAVAGALALTVSADLTPIAQITSTYDDATQTTANGYWTAGSAGMVGQDLTESHKVENAFEIPADVDPAAIESITIQYKASNANGEWGNGDWIANTAGGSWQQIKIIAEEVTDVTEITIPFSLVDGEGNLTDWYAFGFIEYGGASYEVYSVTFNVSESDPSSQESSEAEVSEAESSEAEVSEAESSEADASSEEISSEAQGAVSETDSKATASSTSSTADKSKDKNPSTGAAALGGLGVLLAGAAVAAAKRK